MGFVSNSGVENLSAVTIVTPDCVYSVFEDQRVVTRVARSDPEPAHPEAMEYRYVSGYMTEMIESCLSGSFREARQLPGLEESYAAHRVVFQYMEQHSLVGLNIS